MEKVIKKHQAEEAGKQILENLSDNKRTPQDVSKEFWTKTFPQMDKIAQKRALLIFLYMLTALMYCVTCFTYIRVAQRSLYWVT